MPYGFSRSLHAGWFTLVDKAARVTTLVGGVFIDVTLCLRREAQRSRRIAEGAEPPGERRRAVSTFVSRRKFTFAAAGAVAAAIGLAIHDKTEAAGVALFVSIVFGALEFDALGRG